MGAGKVISTVRIGQSFSPLKKNMTDLDKVEVLWGRHNFLQYHNLRFVLCSNGQIYGGDFAKFVAF